MAKPPRSSIPLSAAKLADRLRLEGKKNVAFFAGLSVDYWQQVVYQGENIWRVQDVLAHFVSAERAFLVLFGNILMGGVGSPEDFSIDDYNNSQVVNLQMIAPHILIADFIEARAATCAWVTKLSDFDLEKKGRHPFLGMTTLFEMIRMVYLHNQIHYRDLRRALSV